MVAVVRTVLYVCCMVIAFLCLIAALTITAAVVTNKLPDPQAWMAVVYFVLVGGFAWTGGRAARRGLSSSD